MINDVFAWIAHKDGFWHVLIANTVGTAKELRRDLADCAKRGLTITPYPDRESYLAALRGLSMYGDPEMDAQIKLSGMFPDEPAPTTSVEYRR